MPPGRAVTSTPVNDPTDASARRLPRAAVVWLAVAAVVVLARIPTTAWNAAARAGAGAEAVGRVLTETPAQRIERASSISPALVRAVREAIPAEGRLVLYFPYPGEQSEFLLRHQFECIKNLLYPAPRDVAFARTADELRGLIAPGDEGRLFVYEGALGPSALTVGGRYELLHERTLGAVRLRLWRLEECR